MPGPVSILTVILFSVRSADCWLILGCLEGINMIIVARIIMYIHASNVLDGRNCGSRAACYKIYAFIDSSNTIRYLSLAARVKFQGNC